MKISLCFALFVLGGSLGCASYTSTIMSRMSNDCLRKNSNQCVKGIPVTVKIPTHIDAVITEEYFLVQGSPFKVDDGVDVKDTTRVETKIANLGKPLRSVSLQTVYTPKVLTTNFIRPAAGTLAIGAEGKDGITMDPDNYFASIQAAIDDQTLEDINGSMTNINKILGIKSPEAKKVSAGGEATSLTKCESFQSTIAYRRFDINEPGWEMELQAFVDGHIGCQQQPCGAFNAECYEGGPYQQSGGQ